MRMRDDSNSTDSELNRTEMNDDDDDDVQSALKNQTSNHNDYRNPSFETLQLKFQNKPSSEVLTGREICGDRCSKIQVVLVDRKTGHIVNSGPESSSEVEIAVSVVRGPLEKGLIGNVRFNLENGIGFLHNVRFTHTKLWTRKCEVRLIARITGHNRNRVEEGKSESFTLLDQRSKVNGKHDPPTPSDEIWRLRAIQKDGPFHGNLNREQIITVKDLLILLNTDQQKLKDILGPGFHGNNWNTMVNHARNCEVDQSLLLYWSPISLHKIGVVFNSVGLLTGLFIENEYTRAERLPTAQKDVALQLIRSAFADAENISCFDNEASLSKTFSDLSIASTAFNIIPNFQEANGSLDLQQASSFSKTISDKNQTLCPWSELNYDEFDHLDHTNSICDTESMFQAFAQDERSRFSDDHAEVPSSANADITMDVVPRKCVPKSNRAHMRWKILSSVMRLVSVRKKGEEKQVGSTSSEQVKSSDYCVDEHLQLLESESKEDRESAVNEILRDFTAGAMMNKAQRKYVPKRDIAQRKWRVLSSVMKFCSLRNGRMLNGQTAHFGSTEDNDDDDGDGSSTADF
ncbi:calmodulin-binding protein 60 A-like isoform X2 [Impatiens glandulifera]|nr:calmodulin-binding protein 60 A-like isoform X2 [Impatiens glandulifera]